MTLRPVNISQSVQSRYVKQLGLQRMMSLNTVISIQEMTLS